MKELTSENFWTQLALEELDLCWEKQEVFLRKKKEKEVNQLKANATLPLTSPSPELDVQQDEQA